MPRPDTARDQRENHPYPLMLRPNDLADRIGVTRRYLYKLLKHPDPAQRLPSPLKIGRATFWRTEDIQNWINRQAVRSSA